jgi:Tfp pilus assembly protein PilN
VIRVNLLAPATEPQARAWRRWLIVPAEQRAALVGLTMLVATAMGVGTSWWSIDRERRAVESSIAGIEATLTRVQEAARLMARTVARERALQERRALIERLRAAQRAPVVLLDTISRSLTEGLWLIELRQTGATVQLDGRAVSLPALTEFIDRLQTSGHFVGTIDILTTQTQTETVADVSVVRFSIRGDVASLAPQAGENPGPSGGRASDPKGGV